MNYIFKSILKLVQLSVVGLHCVVVVFISRVENECCTALRIQTERARCKPRMGLTKHCSVENSEAGHPDTNSDHISKRTYIILKESHCLSGVTVSQSFKNCGELRGDI